MMGALGDCRDLVPRTPPEGLLAWAEGQEEMGTHGLLYGLEWLDEDWDLCFFLDPCAKRKKVKMVRVQCSCCGQSGYFHYGRDGNGKYGFIHPESYDADFGATPTVDGDMVSCPLCGEQGRVILRANMNRRGYVVTGEIDTLTASVVGEERLLCLTGWHIERRVYKDGSSRLKAIPAEAYVFSAEDCVQLKGWRNSYSGTAGYFISYSDSWRQPKDWQDQCGEASAIYGLTPELVAGSALPHCKLDVYMDAFQGTHRKYPVAYLRLVQKYPSAEHLLMAMPMLFQELLAEQIPVNWTETNQRGKVSIPGIDWTARRPARMLGLNREELALAQRQGWGAALWRLYIQTRAAGEILTDADMVNAFRLGADDLYRLVGAAPVGRSIRYLLEQIELDGRARAEEYEDDSDFYVEPCELEPYIDAGYLLDYWTMAGQLGRHLEAPRIRWPADLRAAHDEAMDQLRQRKESDRSMQFRLRRKQLWRYCWRCKGLLVRPAKSQRELTEEGDALCHCVSTYGQRHAAGDTAIFFIRRVSAPGKPYFTLELDEKTLTVRQNRGLCNCARTPEVAEFERVWLEWIRAGCPKEAPRRSGAA